MSARQRTVLVVEDETVLRFEICHHLIECGYAVLEAVDAAEAIRLMVRNRGIDVLFSDVKLPGKSDGLDLARWALKHYPGMAVMLTSGYEGQLNAMRELCGGNALPKPYRPGDVSARILALLEGNKN